MITKLRVESDGDRYPKDVYLVDDQGIRVATIEYGGSENGMFKLARAICRAFNQPAKKRRVPGKQEETVCEDGDVFHPPCPNCGSRSTDCGCD